MSLRRALVLNGGQKEQLRAGDRLAGSPTVRIYLNAGMLVRIPMDDNGELPLKLASGISSGVPVVGAIHVY